MVSNIRKFRESDADRCREIIKACFDGPVALFPEKKKAVLSVMLHERYLEDAAQRYDLLVYESDGQVLGMGAYEDNEIKRIFVDPSEHGQGIGGKMLSYLEQMAVAAGADELILHPFDNSGAFYLKRGYKLTDTFTFEVSGEKVTLAEMVKKV